MTKLKKIKVTEGIYWVEVPEVNLYVLCGCPADSIKHLMKMGLILTTEVKNVCFETGPNAILLSDVFIQNGCFSNLAEFPVLQMLYRQGMILPNHPNNNGEKPMLIGSEGQVNAQMEYIYRGNYGLISEDEIQNAGISSNLAKDMMRLKLKFSFGQIKKTDQLLDTRIIANETVEIKNNVFIKRIKLNVFEFSYNDEKITVDLNIKTGISYHSPYPLGFYNIKREYFGVIHSGEGDGWDINRPTMSSILMFQGKIYLIDAGPNMLFTLNALGIGINEIEGIFHTHSHDDHFCGIPILMQSDHKIKYYSTSLVRESVMKKVSALISIDEDKCYSYFEVYDLEFDIYNNINGLEVMPIFSPHPVETNIFIFRAAYEGGFRTYAHFADIVSLDVLEKMIVEDKNKIGISKSFFEKTKNNYLIPSDIKKLDIGGGLIHGNAIDFKNDLSGKLILSHTAFELTDEQKEIGSGSPFGMVDILIPGMQDYAFRSAYEFLNHYFIDTPIHSLNILLNNPVLTFNPQTILIKAGELTKYIYLILHGNVEMIQSDKQINSILSAGSFLGEISSLVGEKTVQTYRATSFVQALRLPVNLFIDFIKQNGLYSEIKRLQDNRQYLKNTWLFGESISYTKQIEIARNMTLKSFDSNLIVDIEEKGILLIKNGKVRRTIGDNAFETLSKGNFFGEESILFGTSELFSIKTIEKSEIYFINASIIDKIPVIRWKLFEIYEKRKELILYPDLSSNPVFEWRNEYNVNIHDMDIQHQSLFKAANELYKSVENKDNDKIQKAIQFLVNYTNEHFNSEEKLMKKYNFVGYESHKEKHKYLIDKTLKMKEKFMNNSMEMHKDLINFFKIWIVEHILREDRQYGHWINEKQK